ncbi:hypothetical protein GWN26_14605, partial [Candidatus Saccharibacteria bacterium]|nr:hypothetical protein [Candidatus Saccharibacteria bacterium]NIW80633.1 hypothetical protein [Calditrichia bacterium]
FIGPDNGVFSFVFQREGAQVYEILLDEFAEEISTTFHGRDVFAPIAAWIAAKKSLKNYLAPVKEAHTFLHSPHQISENEFEIEVMHVDHFGNLIL